MDGPRAHGAPYPALRCGSASVGVASDRPVGCGSRTRTIGGCGSRTRCGVRSPRRVRLPHAVVPDRPVGCGSRTRTIGKGSADLCAQERADGWSACARRTLPGTPLRFSVGGCGVRSPRRVRLPHAVRFRSPRRVRLPHAVVPDRPVGCGSRTRTIGERIGVRPCARKSARMDCPRAHGAPYRRAQDPHANEDAATIFRVREPHPTAGAPLPAMNRPIVHATHDHLANPPGPGYIEAVMSIHAFKRHLPPGRYRTASGAALARRPAVLLLSLRLP